MDLRQLNTFITLSTIKNFTKTADLLGYAQSSITAQIKQLEEELGTRLFDRIGRSVTLTSAGEQLIPYAEKMIALSSNMKNMLAPCESIKGSIVIGAAESLCITRLSGIIKSYKSLYPQVDIYLKLLDCHQFLPLLSRNSIDIAFTIGTRIHSDFLMEPLAHPEPVCVFSAPSHPLAKKESVCAKDFDQEPFILTETGCYYRGAFLEDLSRYQITPKIILETGSIQAIKEMSASGLGLCLLPEIAAKREIKSKELIPLCFLNNYDICSQILYHKDKWLSPALSAFLVLAQSHWEDCL